MPNPFVSLKSKLNTIKENSKPQEVSLRVLLCHQNIWGSDTFVAAIQDKNDISKLYWIEQIEVIQFSRAVVDSVIEQSYDVLIIDKDLDRGCLEHTVSRVREIDDKIKIIVSTNTRTPEINQLLSEGKIDAVLLVPFQIIPLWELLHELLSK